MPMTDTDKPDVPDAPKAEENAPGAVREYLHNLRRLPETFRASLVRHGKPTSNRTRSQAVLGNFFLHVMPVRLHGRTLRFTATLGLGIITLVLFGLLTITGVLLMIYYKPAVDQAYNSMKDIVFVVPTGRFIRNIHRWSAHAMVACAILHMARVFYTAAYKKPREFNWVLGMGLFVLTLLLSFTGYLLPWDQLAYWAITVGSNIAQSPQEITDVLGITHYFNPGQFIKELLLGSHYVGQEALIRFYVLHVMALPLITTVLVGVHFWRIRKDGGLGRPDEPDLLPATLDTSAPKATEASTKTWGLMALMPNKTPLVDQDLDDTVPTYPNGLYAVAALAMLTTAVMLVLAYFFDAPLKEMANPMVPENPAKAPWYFLGLQELVSYSAFMGGVGIPTIAIIGLALIPYLDREPETPGRWVSGRRGLRMAIASAVFALVVTVGMLVLTVNLGWLRNWFPNIEQWIIILLNPGTVLVTAYALWSIGAVRKSNSTRMGAIALFTCFLVAFAILTYFATFHRGPNWGFYWSSASWPTH